MLTDINNLAMKTYGEVDVELRFIYKDRAPGSHWTGGSNRDLLQPTVLSVRQQSDSL